MGPVCCSTNSTPWGAYSPAAMMALKTIQKQGITVQPGTHSLLDQAGCTTGDMSCPMTQECHTTGATTGDMSCPVTQTVPHHRSQDQTCCSHWVMMPCIHRLYMYISLDNGTLRVITARDWKHAILSGSVISHSISVRWHCRVHGHERYIVSTIEG